MRSKHRGRSSFSVGLSLLSVAIKTASVNGYAVSPNKLLMVPSRSACVRGQTQSRSHGVVLKGMNAAAATAEFSDQDKSSIVPLVVPTVARASKREMLSFAIPALGIYLTNPLMSNIDNAFVGRTVGTLGLAALSPATVCTDQMLYLFSFLARATTGIVARVHDKSNTQAAREAASART